MELQSAIHHLSQNKLRIKALVTDIDEESAHRRPQPESWSIVEVVNHLYDEEREDFRVRLDILLHRPEESWPPIDPPGWVVARRYNDRDLAPSLEGFLDERMDSSEWLKGLGQPDLERSGPAPWGGELRAGDMLAAWVAHDLLHMRQIVETHWALTQQATQPYTTRYAGEW